MTFDERRDWLTKNHARITGLCGLLDKAGRHEAQREMFDKLSAEEHDLMREEWWRRCVNQLAPVGSLVCPLDPRRGFGITHDEAGSMLSAVYGGTATVISQVDGMFTRYLMLHVPWQNLEGRMMQFVSASAHELHAYAIFDD